LLVAMYRAFTPRIFYMEIDLYGSGFSHDTPRPIWHRLVIVTGARSLVPSAFL